MPEIFDVIVLGVGSMGSSAMYECAKAGLNVLGIEQFEVTHNMGSHSGDTRIIRKAYFEHSDYVPLLESAYKGWQAIENKSGEELVYNTGLVYHGNPNHTVIKGIKQSAKDFNLTLEKGQNYRHESFSLPASFESIYEADAGFILPEKAIKAFLSQSLSLGASIVENEAIKSIAQHGEFIELMSDNALYRTKKVIVTNGAYINSIIPHLRIRLDVTQQLIFWIKPDNSKRFLPSEFPCWMIADDSYPGLFYGFPMLDPMHYGGNGLLKIAHHTAGKRIQQEDIHLYNESLEIEKMDSFLEEYLPDLTGKIQTTSACLYTNTIDEHFVIDFLAESNQNIILATGFSGHGFKFVPVIGEILKDLVVHGKTTHPIDFLRANRFR